MRNLFSFSKSKTSKSSSSSSSSGSKSRSVSSSGPQDDPSSQPTGLPSSSSQHLDAPATYNSRSHSNLSPSPSSSNLQQDADNAGDADGSEVGGAAGATAAAAAAGKGRSHSGSTASSTGPGAGAGKGDVNGVPPGTPPSTNAGGGLTPSASSSGLASDATPASSVPPTPTTNASGTPASPAQAASGRRGFLSGRSSKSSVAAAAALQSAQEMGGGPASVGSSGGNGGSSRPGTGDGSNIPTTQTILANPLQPSSSIPSNGASSGSTPASNGSDPKSLTPSLSTSASGSGVGSAPGTGPSPSGGIQLALPGDKHSRTFDVDEMISRLLDAGYTGKVTKSVCLKNAEITAICLAAREVFLSQPTLIELSPPVKIVGDVHGQYSDLIRLFEMCGFPPQANFLFLGDYVDRGKQSLETILLLLCYKIKFPENFFLLRGNHECANVTRVYGFYDECKRRCNIKIWKTFIDVFNCLPICAIVASKIFCVHGGLSPSLTSMDDIRRIARPVDVPDYGLLNDLLWSDPSDTALDWEDNERGVSYCFGRSVIQEFLARYDFDLICRAHMVVEDGYEFWQDRMLVTIFSAPNYCGEFQNFAAVMSVSEDLLCAFELLKPLDGPALKKEMARNRRRASGVPSSSS